MDASSFFVQILRPHIPHFHTNVKLSVRYCHSFGRMKLKEYLCTA